MKREKSITRALMMTLTGTVIAVWLLALGLGVHVMRHELDEIFDSTLQETTDRLLTLILDDIRLRQNSDEAHISELQLGSHREYLTYQVRDRAGTIIFRSLDAPDKGFDVPLQPGFADTQKHRVYTSVSPDGSLFLQVADRFANRREAVRESAEFMVLPLLILVPATIFLIRRIVGRALQPIDALRTALSTKDSGNLAPIESDFLPRELTPIARSVNLLLARLSEAFAAEREFTANSAHELRTPIAGALAQTQRLVEELPPGALQARAANVEASLSNLSHLAEKLLQLARADAGIATQATYVDVRPILDIVVTDFERDADTAGRLRYGRETATPLMRRIDIDAFAILMRNLIENAIIHGEAGTPVHVDVAADGTIRVVNAAAPLSPDELARLKERFQRGRTSASGSGLGLAISERIVTQMGGELHLISPASGQSTGFEARVVLAQ